MFFTNLSKREKSLLYIAMAVIFLSLMYNFILKPLGTRWSQLNRQVIDKEIKVKRNTRYLQQKDNVKDIYQKYAGYAQKESLDEEEIASLLNTVEKQARSLGIHIVNIRPKPVEDLEFCKKYILETNCEATMGKFIEFIYNLQKTTQLIRVEKMKLTSLGKDNPLLKAQLFITKVVTAN